MARLRRELARAEMERESVGRDRVARLRRQMGSSSLQQEQEQDKIVGFTDAAQRKRQVYMCLCPM